MSAGNGEVCCNCRHNTAIKSNDGNVYRYCEVRKIIMSYAFVMTEWCRNWATDAKKWKEVEE